jgi:hypothetical protein
MIKFYPNCTLPPSTPAFVLAPNTRSTLEIIWSCLTTLLLCTWSILHLNVPPQVTPQTKWQKIKRWILFSTTKFKWMVITLLAPEIIMGLASSALWSALDNNKKMKELVRQDGVAWSTAHSFYANMGGFVIKFSEFESQESTESQDIGDRINGSRSRGTIGPTQPPQQDLDTQIYEGDNAHQTVDQRDNNPLPKVSYLNILNKTTPRSRMRRIFGRISNAFRHLSMDRLHHLGKPHWRVDQEHWEMALELQDTRGATSIYLDTSYLQGNIWVLSAAQIALARNLRIIDCLPNLSEDELADKNKGNLLVKGLAILQIIWMMIQLIWRWREHKPASQLEVMTVSFTVCAFITYALMWSRPQGVETPTVIQGNRVSRADMKSLADIEPEVVWFRRALYTMPNNTDHDFRAMAIGGGFGSILFGILHLFAWNFTFPTEVERTLWRVSSFVTFLAPVTYVVIGVSIDKIFESVFGPNALNATGTSTFDRLLLILISFAFIVARLFLLVESFRSLYFLPADVFVTTWASNIPHPF